MVPIHNKRLVFDMIELSGVIFNEGILVDATTIFLKSPWIPIVCSIMTWYILVMKKASQ